MPSLGASIHSAWGSLHTVPGGLYTQSLAHLVTKCEDLFMGGQKKELRFNENYWSLFKLTCNKPCCDSGDAIYYCATCSEDPGSIYAVKVGTTLLPFDGLAGWFFPPLQVLAGYLACLPLYLVLGDLTLCLALGSSAVKFLA